MSGICSQIRYAGSAKLSAGSFANDAKKDLSQKALVFCIGNQAGDLDTIVSSLALAYFEQSQDDSRTFVPLMPFTRSEFRLRGDARKLFEQADFAFDGQGAPSSLLFIDEVDWQQVGKDTSVMLTDHNKLHPGYSSYFPGGVLKIVDHHKNEQAHPEVSEESKHLDEGVASACTLVGNMLLESGLSIPCDLATLLLGTVLVDTRNFSTEKKLFNERDTQVVEALEAMLFPTSAEANKAEAGAGSAGAGAGAGAEQRQQRRGDWFAELMDARYDVSALSVADLLKLDYKQVQASFGQDVVRVGCAAIFVTPEQMVARAAAEVAAGGGDSGGAAAATAAATAGAEKVVSDMQALCAARKLHVLVGLCKREAAPATATAATASAANQIAPEALAAAIGNALQSAPEGLAEDLKALPLFQRQRVTEIGYDMAAVDAYPPLSCWRIGTTITRKTVLPTVTAALNQHVAEIEAEAGSNRDVNAAM
eukprot:g2349.t1